MHRLVEERYDDLAHEEAGRRESGVTIVNPSEALKHFTRRALKEGIDIALSA
jgi:hypothetical protein